MKPFSQANNIRRKPIGQQSIPPQLNSAPQNPLQQLPLLQSKTKSGIKENPRDNQVYSDEVEVLFSELWRMKATQDEDRYFHHELDDPSSQFRCLLLKPSTGLEDPIECTLQVLTLEQAKTTTFDALSYACGDQNNRKDIRIDGLKLSVTSNLHQSLTDMRHPTRYQRLWADAISIHQTNLHEKSQQILLMRDIYSLASEVVIWLGESDSELDTLLQELAILGQQDMAKQTSAFYKMFQFAEKSNEQLRGFIKLFQKPWFHRVWCTQECLLASKPVLICGKYRIPWQVVNTALTCIDMIWPNKKSGIQKQLQEASKHSMAGTMYITFQYSKKIDLGMILTTTSSKEATDPRDKVYAVLGLLVPEMRKTLAPDYTQTLSQIYQNAMLVMCREHSVLNPLWAAAGRKADPKLGIPTWCINFSDTNWHRTFTALHDFPLMSTKFTSGAPGFPPAGGSHPAAPLSKFEYDPQYSRLAVDGVKVGIVEQATPMTFSPLVQEYSRMEQLMDQDEGTTNGNDDKTKTMLSDLASKIVYQFLQDIRNASEHVRQYVHKRGSSATVQSRLQNADVWRIFQRGFEMKNILNDIWTKAGLTVPLDFGIFESFLNRIGDNIPKPSTWEIYIPPQVRSQMDQSRQVDDCVIKSCLALGNRTPDRSIIITDTGYLGCAGLDVQVGDELCVVFKCNQPLLLRADGVDQSGRKLYSLVTSAWVNGLMKGELIKRGDIVSETFVLV